MKKGLPIATKLQNIIFAWLIAWPVIGVYADGWHHHHLDSDTDALFNPFHQFFYAGAVAVAIFLVIMAYRNYKRGYPLKNSLPTEYKISALGLAIFFGGTVLDLCWHHIFGFEKDIDALFSPTHLLMAVGALTAGSVLLRPIWNKNRDKNFSPIVPVLGFTYYLLAFVFFTQYAHPYYQAWMAQGTKVEGTFSMIQTAALAGGLLRTFIFCTMLFSTLKFFKFPKGSVFAILSAEGVGIAFMGGQYQYIAAAAITGLLTEIIYQALYDRLHETWQLRVFGFLIAAIFFIPYIFTALVYDPTWWSVHLVSGLVVQNGIVGYLLTFLIQPPQVAGETT